MSPEFIESMSPEPAPMVDAPQVPVSWTWSANKLMIAGLLMLAVCLGVYFVVSYSSEKAKAAAKAAESSE